MDPSPDLKISFYHPECTQRSKFCVYANFKTGLNPVPEGDDQPNPTKSYSLPKQIHIPYSYSYYAKYAQTSSPLPDCTEVKMQQVTL